MWPTSSWSLTASCEPRSLAALGEAVYPLVCRTDFDQPGFCLIDLGTAPASHEARRLMVGLKRALQQIHQRRTGWDLIYLACARFDQQVTTKFHRDGAPEEGLLMLGYEPSEIPSQLGLADYSKCAFDLGLTPAEFLDQHNPMFAVQARLLDPDTTVLTSFNHRRHQLVLINNSMASSRPYGHTWQGVLHTATIIAPNENLRRVINSTTLATVPLGTAEPVSLEEQDEFVTTTVVRRKGYDTPARIDDP